MSDRASNREVARTAGATSGRAGMFLRDEPAPLDVGEVLAGRYRLEEAIGQGATGWVYRVVDRETGTVLAMKVLDRKLADQQRWSVRLETEVRNARRVVHQNVCRVFDIVAADGHDFFTMELATGGSLLDWLQDDRPRTFDDRVATARAIIEGLAAIHHERVLHRDIKPENILFMDDGRLVVSDFGFAVALDHTTLHSLAGTPSYMAPEVVIGDKATLASDVWSLAVVIHEVLFGKRPEWILTKHKRSLKMPDRSRPVRERALMAMLADCLIELPTRRLRDAIEVQRRFAKALDGWMPKPWSQIATGVALAAVAATVIGTVLLRPPPTAPTKPRPFELALSGAAADWSKSSRVLMSRHGRVRCLDTLPGGKSVRAIWDGPLEAVDVDLTTGTGTPSPLAPETYRTSCPQLSPDGKRVLFSALDANKRPQIMLSHSPDGSNAAPLTEGSSPIWLRSGNEFVYNFDRRRAAVYSIGGLRQLLPDTGPTEKSLQSAAVDDRGSRVAFLVAERQGRNALEIYDYPSLALSKRLSVRESSVSVQFDSRQHSFGLITLDGLWSTRARLTDDGRLVREGYIPARQITALSYTPQGPVLAAVAMESSLYLRDPSGTERLLDKGAFMGPTVSAQGDVLVGTMLPDGRNVIAMVPGNGGAIRPLTAGPSDRRPMFGADGKTVFYISMSRNAIVRCTFEEATLKKCATAISDPLGPTSFAPSPDGATVAYLTRLGTGPRLHVAKAGAQRDLGAFSSLCRPNWASNDEFWLYEGRTSQWQAFSTTSGATTGETRPPVTVADPCARPPFADATGSYSTRTTETQLSELRLVARRP